MRFAAVTATAKEAAVKQVIGMVLAAVLLVGCAKWRSVPYSAQEAREGSGGAYSGDGTCYAGLE
jgi:hypothetical protein